MYKRQEVVSLAIELVAEEALEGKDVGLALAEKVLAHLLELSDGQFETLNVTRSASNIQTGAYIRNSVTAESAEAFAEDEVLKYDTAMSYTDVYKRQMLQSIDKAYSE